jgi:hypothetical protein
MQRCRVRGLGHAGARALVILTGWAMFILATGTSAAAAGPGVATLASGEYHACAVRTNATVWCWGDDGSGQLGDGTTGGTDGLRSTPVQVLRGTSTLKGVTKIAAGASHSCAVRTDGSVWCWGDASDGQLGNDVAGIGAHRTKAVRVRRLNGDLTGVQHVALGGDHSCALRDDGAVFCWGWDAYGQVGDGTTGEGMGHVRSLAVRVRQGSGYLGNVVAIAAGAQHSCAAKGDGSVWCWGDGSFGQLGDGESGLGHQHTKASRVERGGGYLTRASGITAGEFHTCVRRTDASTWCWGSDQDGQLGDGTTGGPVSHLRTKPVQVLRGSGELTSVTGVGAGSYHTCARRSDGSAWCWGDAHFAQLGDGTTGDSTTHLRLKAVRVVRSTGPFTNVRKVAGGIGHTCALRTDATVWCWGYNANGQLGRGTHDDDPHPYPRKVVFP